MKSLLKLFLSTQKIVFRNIKRSLLRVPAAALYCIFCFRNKTTHYIIICDHIGDFVLTMGYLNAYRNEQNLSHITVCTTSNLSTLLPAYSGDFDSVCILNERQLHMLLPLSSTNFGEHIRKKLKNITIINPTNAFTEEFFDYPMRYPQIHFPDCIRYGCLGLSKDAVYKTPDVCGFKTPPCSFEPASEKPILLSLHARTIEWEKDEDHFFSTLVKKLKESHYQVYTNLSSETDQPFPGTLGISCTLSEIYTLVQRDWAVIGLRSGLLDLLMYTECKIAAIYPLADPLVDFFDIRELPSPKARAFQLARSEDMDHDIEQIIDFLEGDSICQ